MFDCGKQRDLSNCGFHQADIDEADATTSSAAHAETVNLSNGNDKEILELAFGEVTSSPSRATQSGRWETELAFLMSDVPEASTYLEATVLSDLDKRFSISSYLSTAGVHQVGPNVILHKRDPIDGALLVCLALNEECRKKKTGVFYHLPLRENLQVGHACDLVFKPKKWEVDEEDEWDNASWVQRLDQYRIDQSCYDKIDSSDRIIPICTRVLHFSEEPVNVYKQGASAAADLSQGDSKQPLPKYCSDPAVVENTYRYSRPIQDLSTYLILYPCLHVPPLVCATGVFEDEAHCDRHPTQHDMSETFMLRVKCDAAVLHGRLARAMYELSRKRHVVAGKPIGSNAEVVECLLKAWKGEGERHKAKMTTNGGKVQFSWQELRNMMETGPEMRS